MNRLIRALAVAAAACMAASASAQELGEFRDWRAHLFTEDGKRVCTMWSQPGKAEGKYERRGEIFALVNHRPAENRLGIVSFELGYPFASGKDLAVSIDGGAPIRLPTSGSLAWHDSAEVNAELVKKMRAGNRMVVTGESKRGTKTTDTYSLSGFTAGWKAISKACGVR